MFATAWRFGRYLWFQVTQPTESWQLNTFQTFFLAWAPWMLAAALLAIGLARRSLSWPLATFVALNLVLIGANGHFISANRYVLSLFPLYFVVADGLPRRVGLFQAWLATSGGAGVVLLVVFSTKRWAG